MFSCCACFQCLTNNKLLVLQASSPSPPAHFVSLVSLLNCLHSSSFPFSVSHPPFLKDRKEAVELNGLMSCMASDESRCFYLACSSHKWQDLAGFKMNITDHRGESRMSQSPRLSITCSLLPLPSSFPSRPWCLLSIWGFSCLSFHLSFPKQMEDVAAGEFGLIVFDSEVSAMFKCVKSFLSMLPFQMPPLLLLSTASSFGPMSCWLNHL